MRVFPLFSLGHWGIRYWMWISQKETWKHGKSSFLLKNIKGMLINDNALQSIYAKKKMFFINL